MVETSKLPYLIELVYAHGKVEIMEHGAFPNVWEVLVTDLMEDDAHSFMLTGIVETLNFTHFAQCQGWEFVIQYAKKG